MHSIEQTEYSKLAEIYDALMEDVDYEAWADFIDEIIQINHPEAFSILELACGTGSLALSLDELMCYDILATDKSPEMIAKARNKAGADTHSIRFGQADFLNINIKEKFDVIVSIFDSINYLYSPDDIRCLLSEVQKVLEAGGIFIFDFTTPDNSIEAIKYLNNEEGYAAGNYRFFRKSSYDAKQKIHYNNFRIEELDPDQETVIKQYTESHKQRIYTLKEMSDIISETDFTVAAAYDAFGFNPAHDKSLRITMVLRCPKIQ